jgi:hypothetical protein
MLILLLMSGLTPLNSCFQLISIDFPKVHACAVIKSELHDDYFSIDHEG